MKYSENKRGVLLVNLGSPGSTSVTHVRMYLRAFLMDARVIDAPYPIRKMIVELFILPFRPKNSAHAYQTIWWDEGSPLIVLSQRLHNGVQEKLEIPVELGMRYGNPSIESGIRKLINQGVQEIFLFPLYPHYAMATYETVVVEA
ncbi:MAG: ferrochelatase, partial [Calditrichaeota bacterium]|nr:ferrochelatase [Calditrichota bacterium]